MTFKEIIEENCKKHCEYNWWPKFAYHYTDIENAILILDKHTIFSRTDALEEGLMKNDNANVKVISNTGDAVNYARFYFRPLTPTQYRNEGFKHPDLSYQQKYHANVPVPIFFVFDLCKMLESTEGIVFSEMGQAGYGSPRSNTIEEFSKFNFNMIYSANEMSNVELEKRYRHAEILVPRQYDIDFCLKYIVCRSECEKRTLLYLLREHSTSAYIKYKDRIIRHDDMFYKNGFAIEDCVFNGRDVIISLMGTRDKTYYTAKERINGKPLRKLEAKIQVYWHLKDYSKSSIVTYKTKMDYENPTYYTICDLARPTGAKSIFVKVWVEEKLMCFMTKHLSQAALI